MLHKQTEYRLMLCFIYECKSFIFGIVVLYIHQYLLLNGNKILNNYLYWCCPNIIRRFPWGTTTRCLLTQVHFIFIPASINHIFVCCNLGFLFIFYDIFHILISLHLAFCFSFLCFCVNFSRSVTWQLGDVEHYVFFIFLWSLLKI